MKEVFQLLIGICVLILAWPVGKFLAWLTKEELKAIQIYVKLIVIVSMITGFVGLFIKNDWLLFSMFFIAIVASKSLLGK